MNFLTGVAISRCGFLWCPWVICMPFPPYRSWSFAGLQRRAVHLQPPQFTALKAAFVYDAAVVRPSWTRSISCRFAEIKAPVSAHKLQRVHKLRPAQGLRHRLQCRGRQRENAQHQREGVGARETAHGTLEDITQMPMKEMTARHPLGSSAKAQQKWTCLKSLKARTRMRCGQCHISIFRLCSIAQARCGEVRFSE